MSAPNTHVGAERVTDPLLDVGEAARYLGCGERLIRRLVAQRRIRSLRVGRFVRLRTSDLEGYLRDHTVEPAPPPRIHSGNRTSRVASQRRQLPPDPPHAA